MVNMSKDVEFQDVVYTVKVNSRSVTDSKRKCLLQGVSGVFKNGQLSAIMGPSGAGKSSLLNAISGLRTSGVSGNIIRNRKTSCYLTQEDYHQPYLSVIELMQMACNLKLKPNTDHEPVINEILKNLNLNHRRTNYANQLSGGERRRLSIALELVANPTIFFLDEPTSGLDEVTASQCIRLLKNLAKQNRTVVCTIHQPSATTFALFDHIFVLARGQCVFQGGPTVLVPFLSKLNLHCPTYYNPSDYIIELCDSDDGTIVTALSRETNNGKLMCSIDNVECVGNHLSDVLADVSLNMKNAVTSMFLEKPKSKSRALLEKMKALTKFMQNDHAVSGFRQFSVLFSIMMLKIWRNKSVLLIQLFHHVFCGVIFGLIFFKAANDGERMFDHLKFCIGIVFFLAYTQMIVPILAYPSEVKLLKKECFNRWYALLPYYTALTLSRIPFQILFNLIFLGLTYSMSGLPVEYFRFGLYAIIGLIVSFVAEGMGLAIGATFSITNGSVVGPLLIAPLLGLAIYGFDFAADIPMAMYTIMKMSFVRVGVVSLVLSVFGYDRAQLDCGDVYCHFDDPKVLLRFLRIEKVYLWNEVAFLVMYIVIFRTILYLSLKRRILS
ncbi:ATP-binding cassette sub-family G member 1 [Contarinia nasturtii]|uniref:ATP-binding cassette sub-family G member 1 n=1 Tax=Contarinia nasturtii TaxID=265458 RepID=UPI0012D43DDA|nr:ATP-binding cassette sub-family G member 1 [Contarinia nasturtii]XP_031630021.1 ATP-binding cassette sub-family G member 1 [Contarinia nasturtii]